MLADLGIEMNGKEIRDFKRDPACNDACYDNCEEEVEAGEATDCNHCCE